MKALTFAALFFLASCATAPVSYAMGQPRDGGSRNGWPAVHDMDGKSREATAAARWDLIFEEPK